MDLRDTNLGDVEAVALAEALKMNRTIRTLFLGNNSISDTGAGALAEALRVNKTLTELHLRGNRIGFMGAAVLRASAGSGCTVYGLPDPPASSGGCCSVM